MIASTFGAGCIDNSNSKTPIDAIDNVDTISDDLKKSNEIKENLDKYLKIIENPTNEYAIKKEPITAIDWLKNYVSISIRYDRGYYGNWADVYEKDIVYVDNGISFNKAMYILTSDTITDNYCITVAQFLKENTQPTALIKIHYLTPSDYEQFIIDMHNHI